MKPFTLGVLLVFATTVAGAVPASAEDLPGQKTTAAGIPSRFEIRYGAGSFTPGGHGDFWDKNFETFNAKPSQLNGDKYQLDGIYYITPHSGLLVALNRYEQSFDEPARNQLDDTGNPAFHSLDLNLFSTDIGYLLFPAGTGHRWIPYLGAGLDVSMGSLQTSDHPHSASDDSGDDGGDDGGDPGDPGDPTTGCDTALPAGNPIPGGHTSLFALGYFLDAGMEFRVSANLGVYAEVRRTMVHASLGGDFKGTGSLDLSGQEVNAGVVLRF
jgi:opacity protein-like surface antigen